jgi:hypothetical protein
MIRIPLLVALTLVLAPAPGARSSPPFRPATFVARVDNPWFPLEPGTVYVYRGVDGGKASRDVVVVTHATRMIEGVRATAVRDLVYLEGRLAERTTDWYAQDGAGNVWYLGEATEELDANGSVTSREGSWLAGIGGAEPGIFMPARPVVGAGGRQEYLKGHAEDHFRVVALHVMVESPARSSNQALMTEEWSPLERGVLEHKLYVRGVGTVREQTVRGGDERQALISVRRP